MPRRITPESSLETLRQEAKDWLRELRANDHDARVRFTRALPDGPSDPTLRDVQHARLLDKAQFRFLFPDARHLDERALGLTKSLIAIR